MPLRIIVLGDRIFGASAYSKVVYSMCRGFLELGHEVAHVPMDGALRGAQLGWEGVLVFPSGNDRWGEDIVEEHYRAFKADILITVKDVWVFNSLYRRAMNWCPIVPIDHSPVSRSITARLGNCFKPIAISRHGETELRQQGVENVEYIPHDVDTTVFRPLEGHKMDCRRLFHIKEPEKKFIVGVVAMNRVRKMIPRMLRGFKRFTENNPDIDAEMMLWTNMVPTAQALEEEGIVPGVADAGVHLIPEVFELGLQDKVVWPEPKLVRMTIPDWTGENYVSGWDMVKLYNMFDALLLCSGGEGYGLTLAEAQACGVQVVSSAYTSMPELTGSGYTVAADDYVIINTPGTRHVLASIDGMAEALRKVYDGNTEAMAKKARLFALRYDRKRILHEYWKPFLEKAETELFPKVNKGGTSTWANER